MHVADTTQALYVLALAATACAVGSAAFLLGALAAHAGRRALGPALVVVGLSLVFAPLAVVAARRPAPPVQQEIAIDLGRPQDLSWVPEGARWLGGWGSKRRLDIVGPIDLSLVLPDGGVFIGRVKRLAVSTKDREIQEVRFELPGALPPAQALDFAAREAGWWSATSAEPTAVRDWIVAGRDARAKRKALSLGRPRLEVEVAFRRGTAAAAPAYEVAYRLRLIAV